MRLRFIGIVSVLAALLAVFAGVARALDFDDEDPHPPHPEIGLVYHYEIGTHAGCLPHHVVLSSGQLPPGLTLSQLNDHTALVSGIATDAGTFSAWLAVKDCENKSAEALFSFETWARRWGITTVSLAPAAAGSPYSAKLEGKGVQSNVTWTVSSGSLPAGLALTPDGTISGTPTGGAATFTVTGTAVSVDPAAPGARGDPRQLPLNADALVAAAPPPPGGGGGVPGPLAPVAGEGGHRPDHRTRSRCARRDRAEDVRADGPLTSASPTIPAVKVTSASSGASPATFEPSGQRPLLTAVVPVYNGGPHIVENVGVIQDALARGLPGADVEVIVVSDGSIDDTAERLLAARG